MTQFEERVLTDLSEVKAELSELKTHMGWLVGGGNEGKMHELEKRIKRQEISLYRLGGISAAMGGGLAIAHLALDYMRTVHR